MIWNLIGSHVGETIAVLVVGAVILMRFRRYRAVAGAGVAAVSSAATVVAGILGTLVLLVALGYWDPPISRIVGDILGAAKAFWNFVGEWLVSLLVDALEEVAE